MNSNKSLGRLIGLLLLLMMLAGAAGVSLRGLSSALSESEEFLTVIDTRAADMRLAIFLDTSASMFVLGIAITMFPVISRHKKSLAFWVLGLWVLQIGIVALANVCHLSLLALSKAFTSSGSAEIAHYLVSGRVLIEGYFAAHLLGLIFFGLGAFVFYYALLRSKMLPQFLAGWGMMATSIVAIVSWIQLFDYDVNFGFYIQHGVFLLFVITWLLAKGFNTNSQNSN